jgi:integrase
MTEDQQRPSVFHDPTVLTLAEAFGKFEAAADETADRKARVRSAVSTFCRLICKRADEVPAQGIWLKQRFVQLKRQPTGLAAKSLANCRSELKYLVGKICGAGSRSPLRPLTGEWASLRDAMGDEPVSWKLSRFMAFGSGTNVGPTDVDDEFVERFRHAVSDSGEVERVDQHVRQAIRAWNELAARFPDRALQTLSVPARRVSRWTVEPAQFPASFRQEVEAWLKRLSEVDPEAEEGPIRPLRPASLGLRRHQVFKAASALVFSGRPIESVTSLACLVELEAFKAILRYLRERQGGEPTTALLGLATALKFIAKHEVKVADGELNRIARICANYQIPDRALRSKSRARLMNFEDERLLSALVHLPDRLLEEAGRPRTSPRAARLLAQVAVAIEVEFHTPIRRANLAALRLGTNIQAVKVGGETRWIIRFDHHETKNRSLLVYELSAATVKRIERAFKFYTCTDGWLFPAPRGGHKNPETVALQIKDEVERRLGCPFNLHLFRGLLATMQLRENENGFEMARALLGDRSDRVIRTHYTATAEQHLIRKAQDTVQRVRIRTAPIAPRRP